ncbi:MAG: hypothetical protein V4772_25480 [Pseudomonadota bacterium]
MNNAGKAIVTVLLLAGFAGAVYFSVTRTPGSASPGWVGQLGGAVQTQELSGLIAVDVEPYFQDARVQKILQGKGFRLQLKRTGSRDMAGSVGAASAGAPEFFYASGVVAAQQIEAAAKKANISSASYSPVYTPMVVASWLPIAKILAANGLANETSPGLWTLDLAKLTQTMLDKTRWKDLKNAQTYEVNKSVLVSTTDVRKSNSAAMYLALTSYAVNGGELVTDRETAKKTALSVAGLFKRQGYQENYVNGNFDDYLSIGMGKTPLAFIYENQIVSHALTKKGLNPGMVLLYPQPTVFNKVVFVALSDRAKKLGELLASDAALQQLAVEFGFRIADSSYFVQATQAVKLPVPAQLTQVIDPPSFDVMADMIEVITREMAQ